MPRPTPALALAFVLAAGGARAMELTFPFPVAAAKEAPAETAGYALPTGPFADAALPVAMVEGRISRRAYRLDAPDASLLDVLGPLRAQVEAAGFSILLDCEARACGGFDFRYATEVLPEPDMHVDLGAFRFLSARNGDDAISLLVSRSGASAFVQVTEVTAAALPPAGHVAGPAAPVTAVAPDLPAETLAPDTPVAPAVVPADMAARLDTGLPVVLEDLVFASGSAALKDDDYPSLDMLARWLAANPSRAITLVGHSDASGGMQANVDLSRRRAEAVRQVLIDRHDVPPAQIGAEGVGPLAPRATSQTEEGRRLNRRVEAVPDPLP